VAVSLWVALNCDGAAQSRGSAFPRADAFSERVEHDHRHSARVGVAPRLNPDTP
jgi:hypothetical protein